MGDLEDKIQELAGAGNFSHLSITSSGAGFVAVFCPAASWGQGRGFHTSDPVQAALQAINEAPKGKRKVSPSAQRSMKSGERKPRADEAGGTPSVEAEAAQTMVPNLSSLFTNEGE